MCPSNKMALEGSLPGYLSLSTSTFVPGNINKESWAETMRFMRCYLGTAVHDLVLLPPLSCLICLPSQPPAHPAVAGLLLAHSSGNSLSTHPHLV